MTRAPASVSPLTVPTGSASSDDERGGRERRTPRCARPDAAMTTSARPKTRNVRRVPISGMNSSADANVPSSEPTVEIA